MISRKDYLDGKCSHRKYYAQFIIDGMEQKLLKSIPLEELLSSKDEHLNDISLERWDWLSGFQFRGSEMISKPISIPKELSDRFKETGEGCSSATMVCIYKELARQIIEEEKKKCN